jgi:imidazolonepropionase-like amidohydrolase
MREKRIICCCENFVISLIFRASHILGAKPNMKSLIFRPLAAFFAVAVLIVFGGQVRLFAQENDNSFSVYAITNARLVTVSGAPIERGTVVVRDGLIQSVGANVQVPADARVIDGAGLTVYPGFIDGNTNIGIAAPQRPAAASGVPAAFTPPAPSPSTSNSVFPVGLQPEISAATLIRPNDASFETARNNGFTTALAVPRERLFVGQSALVNTAGDNAAEMIVRSPVGVHVVFQSLQGGVYPTSLMGAFSAVRQMLIDAQRLQEMQKMYAANPRGVRRPDANKSLEALFPVINREIPVVFQANTEREIIRALDMTREFNLKTIIAGGNEAWKVADRLKAQDVPVLISLNFPKRTTSASTEADPEPLDVLRLRVETPKNAARLKQAGVRFAFQSGALTNLNDFWANAGKAVENGLTKDDAVRAMTLSAAEIFGVDKQLGSIEAGKIANLTVTRGDVLDKTKTFTHVFVDGRLFEIKQPAAPAARPGAGGGQTPAAAPTAVNVAGSWTINVEAPGQPISATATFAQQADRLTGTFNSPLGNSEIQSGSISGDQITFRLNVTFGGQTFDVNFSGKVSGNTMTGTAVTPQGSIPFSGTKNP